MFMLVLGGTGFYFYQKQNTPGTPTNSTQSSQNSLTSNPETAKTPNEANNKPKEENLTSAPNPETQISSASFDADPNTDVIVFKECNMMLKVNKNTQPIAISSKFEDEDNVGFSLNIGGYIGEYREPTNQTILCRKDEFVKSEKLKQAENAPEWLKKIDLKKSIKSEYLSQTYPYFYFNDNNLFYSIKAWDTVSVPDQNNPGIYRDLSIISSFKIGIDETDKYNKIKIFDLDSNMFQNIPKINDLNNITQTIQDLNFIGCSEISKSYNIGSWKCFITDQDYNPIVDMSDEEFVNSNGFLMKGKRSDKSVFLVSKTSLNGGGILYNIYNFDFKTGANKLEKEFLLTNDSYSFLFNKNSVTYLFKKNYDGEDCARGKSGIEVKPCIKKDSDYQIYLKAYNDEQAKNKAAQAELAKYLE